MTYLEGCTLLRNIEDNYDVMSCKYKGISIWPYLRLYLLDKMTINKKVKTSVLVVKQVLKGLFIYSPLQMFHQHSIWLFTACERRKRIGNKMIHRISGGISTAIEDYLMIEKPDILGGHYRRKEIEERSIVSESWLLIVSRIIELVSRIYSPQIDNEELLKKILKEHGIVFDYRYYLRLLNAQRLAMHMLMKLTNVPKLVGMECAYTSMGYVWAFHQRGVEVIELQHGVLNQSHIAYNSINYEPKINPDSICVFGPNEHQYFIKKGSKYSKTIHVTGLYMLERADKYFITDIFASYRNIYQSIIVVSGQHGYEQQLVDVINSIANRHPELMFIYIPRRNDEDLQFFSENISFVTSVNIYEYLKWADIHITISSTTCLEAQYFHTPTIFYNYDNMASVYYSNILRHENGIAFMDSDNDFEYAYETIYNHDFKYCEIFAYNHIEKITEVFNNAAISASS